MPKYAQTINIEGHSGIHSEEYERIVFTRGRYTAVEIAGDYNVIIINAGCRFDGKFVVSGDYNKITIHNDVNFNNGILIGADTSSTVGVGNHIKCLGKTFITRDPNDYNDNTQYALQINGDYTHWEGSGMNTKVALETASGKTTYACVIGRQASDGNAVSTPTKWCIVEKTNFMVLYNGSSNGSGKYSMYVNGSTHGAIACGHLITNNWFGTLGGYDSSISAGQDTTGGGGQVALVAGTTRFVENHIQPVYTGGINLTVAGKRNIVLFNHVAHGGSYGAEVSEDNVVFSGNLVYWNDAKGTSAEPIRQTSSADRMVMAGNRGGNKASIGTNATNSQVGNNELGTL
jgi:hypothetical protein|tara:strand:- start:1119 stop:2153 length:1035 start_codon:yes stop_codon:yes gene_type:complete